MLSPHPLSGCLVVFTRCDCVCGYFLLLISGGGHCACEWKGEREREKGGYGEDAELGEITRRERERIGGVCVP